MAQSHATQYCRDVLARAGLPEDIVVTLKSQSCPRFPGMVFAAGVSLTDRGRYPELNELFPRATFVIADDKSCRLIMRGPHMTSRWFNPKCVSISSCSGSYVGWTVFDGWLAISSETTVTVVRLESLGESLGESAGLLGLFSAMWADIDHAPLLDVASRGQFQMEKTSRGLKFVRVLGDFSMNLGRLLDIVDIPRKYLPNVYLELDWERFATMTYSDLLQIHSRIIIAAEDAQGQMIGQCVLKTPGAELVDFRAKILMQCPRLTCDQVRDKILKRYSNHSRITPDLLKKVIPDLVKGLPIPTANQIYFSDEFLGADIAKKIPNALSSVWVLGQRKVTIDVLEGIAPKRVVVVRGNVASDLQEVARHLYGYRVIRREDFYGGSAHAKEWVVREFLRTLRDKKNVCIADCNTELIDIKAYAMNCSDLGMTVVTVENSSPNLMSEIFLNKLRTNPVISFENIAKVGFGGNTVLAFPATPFLSYTGSISVTGFSTVLSRGWDSRPFNPDSLEFQASEILEHRSSRGVLKAFRGKILGGSVGTKKKVLVVIERLGTFSIEDAGMLLLKDFVTLRVRCDVCVRGLITAG